MGQQQDGDRSDKRLKWTDVVADQSSDNVFDLIGSQENGIHPVVVNTSPIGAPGAVCRPGEIDPSRIHKSLMASTAGATSSFAEQIKMATEGLKSVRPTSEPLTVSEQEQQMMCSLVGAALSGQIVFQPGEPVEFPGEWSIGIGENRELIVNRPDGYAWHQDLSGKTAGRLDMTLETEASGFDTDFRNEELNGRENID